MTKKRGKQFALWVSAFVLCIGSAWPVSAQEGQAEASLAPTFADSFATSFAEEGEGSSDICYGAGSYVVGKDIPAGEYAVFADGLEEGKPYRTCSFTLYKSDSDEKLIGKFRFENHGLVSLYDGQHLILASGYAVPAEGAGLTLSPYGMYLAGRDMEPGRYRITPLTADGGYYALYSDVRYYYDYQDEYRMFLEPVEITVTEGQYLELGGAASVERISEAGE